MRRSRSQRNQQRKGPLGARVETISGRSVLNYGAGAAVSALSPALFSRAGAIADLFQFYRFTKIKVTVVPASSGFTTSTVIGYAPGAVIDTPPNTQAAIIELPAAVWHGLGKTVDTVMTLGRKELVSDAQIPWFKTIAGTPDAQFEIQGNFYLFVAVGSSVIYEYTVEFQSWNLAGNSPLASAGLKSKNADVNDAIIVGTPGSEDQSCVRVKGQLFKLVTA